VRNHPPENERIKRRYFDHLRHARCLSDASIDPVAQAINRFEAYTGNRDFKRFHVEQAKGFKRALAEQLNLRTCEPLSKATLHSIVTALKSVFQWLSREPGYRSRLNYSDAEYFNLSEKETRIAKARRQQAVPSIEQILHLIENMPARTDLERRDKALIAFTLVSGARDRAIASMKLKHVNIEASSILQDAREVRTKFAKTFTSTFFPVGEELREIVSVGCDICEPSCSGVLMTRCSQQHGSNLGPTEVFAPPACSGKAGAMLMRFAGYSRKPARRLGCPTSIRTASGMRLSRWVRNGVEPRRSSRPGARISGTRVC
jgi:site-specific recombinase XerD